MTNNNEPLAHAYNALLEKVDAALQANPELSLKEAVEAAESNVPHDELSPEEWNTVKSYLLRDAEHAGRFLAKKDDDDDDLNQWLAFDIEYVEKWLWEQFSKVADKSKLELLDLKENLEAAIQYNTGEIAAPGTLQCMACNKLMTKHKTGKIPPCSGCGGSNFERYVFEEKETNE